jgi:alkylation response protein AidB-like acyl-CoA dehydrogenase
MDFETTYTDEQRREREAFRLEVRAWLDEHAGGAGAPPDAAGLTYDQFQRNRAFLRALGERGWYAPTWPAELGGAALAPHVASVIREELEARIPHLENVHPPGDVSGAAASAVWHVGSDEQKRTLLPQLLRGRLIVWELYTEPEAGSDLPALSTRADRQGDEYVLNGTKTLAGGHFEADRLFVLAVTDPQGARRENLSAFLVPYGAPGIIMTDMDMIAGSKKRTVIFEDARVPASQRIGAEGDGWRAFEMSLHGALSVGIGPGLDRAFGVLDQLIEYCKTARAGAAPLSSDTDVQDALMRAYVALSVQRLLLLRTEWMQEAGRAITYEGAQVALGRKTNDLLLAETLHRALGPLALVGDPAWAPFGGELEYFHRYAILMAHPGGTVEIQKLRMFRGMTGAPAAE